MASMGRFLSNISRIAIKTMRLDGWKKSSGVRPIKHSWSASALIIMAERTEDSASRSWGMSRPSSIVIFVGLIP